MGTKQTKMMPNDIFATPKAKVEITTNDINFDPRSPMDSRTPITLIPIVSTHPDEKSEKYGLRKRLLKGFTCNLNDPRSPNPAINRTPLIFDEKIDRTFNLNDTFADLFVDSNAVPPPLSLPQFSNDETDAFEAVELAEITSNEKNNMENNVENISAINIFSNDSSIEFDSFCDEETMPCTIDLKPTSPVIQTKDPRSPSIGVERTPLIFEDDMDDNATSEDAMLETILATLSLDTSGLSMNSFTSHSSPINKTLQNDKELMKPTNKHLDRVRAVNKRTTANSNKITKRSTRRQHIYEDNENDEVMTMTPKKKTKIIDGSITRTPLSCVRNRAHLRSKSVETSGKSIKKRIQLSSYDDTLNPMQSVHVNNIRYFDDF